MDRRSNGRSLPTIGYGPEKQRAFPHQRLKTKLRASCPGARRAGTGGTRACFCPGSEDRNSAGRSLPTIGYGPEKQRAFPPNNRIRTGETTSVPSPAAKNEAKGLLSRSPARGDRRNQGVFLPWVRGPEQRRAFPPNNRIWTGEATGVPSQQSDTDRRNNERSLTSG